jgi:ABC-2 type transport system ATP-binding protein
VRFGDRWALDGLSFSVAGGEVVGLLGPNGAGKTTTLSVLATLLRPDAGRATIAGHATDREPAAVRRAIGVVPQTLAVYPTLTAWENVLFFARLLGLRRHAARAAAARALELVGLEERRDDIVATFSGGMQRRLNLACGLVQRPPVLLLDEPTAGVDPQSRQRIMTTVRAQASTGTAVLYSTHYIEEAERLCDRVVLVDHGRVIAAGTPVELIRGASNGIRIEVITRGELPSTWLDGIPGARLADARTPTGGAPSRGRWVQVILDSSTAAPRLLERAAALGGELLEFHIHHPDLQDVFINLTGHELRD